MRPEKRTYVRKKYLRRTSLVPWCAEIGGKGQESRGEPNVERKVWLSVGRLFRGNDADLKRGEERLKSLISCSIAQKKKQPEKQHVLSTINLR